MTVETEDMKLLGNFRKLLDLCAADPDYKPSTEALKPRLLLRNGIHQEIRLG